MQANTEELRPPRAARHPHATVLHGDRREDDYFWLRQRGDAEVIAYLEAENAHTDAAMAGTQAFQESLYQEMLARIQQTDLSVPYRQGDWLYYSRTETGKQYPIHCRKPARPAEPEDGVAGAEAAEEVVLDLNALAEGHAFMSLGAFSVSGDGHALAYSTDTTGFRVYQLHIRDLRTGHDLLDAADDVDSVAWSADATTLFYTVKDSAKRPYRLLRHRLGESADTLVHEESDERFGIEVHRSRSRAWIYLSSGSLTQSEVRVLPGSGEGEWRLIAAREDDHEYHVEDHGDRFYILTNQGARNFRLVSAPTATPQKDHWREELAHRPEVMLEGLDCFASHLVLTEREDGLVRLRITDLADGSWHRIEFPEPVYTAGPGINREYETETFRYEYQSFITPLSTYDYDMRARTSTLLKRAPVLGDFDPSNYRSLRQHAVAADGTRIPISIVHRTDRRSEPGPLLLYGYGAYGLPLSASFASTRLSLLDRGVTFAIAHVRGGGEMGKTWHDGGRMLQKQNSFTDFIDCAEHLIAEGWTSPEHLAILGGSAGGLLMGAVANLRPELFHTVLSQVPFVDVINTMSDATLPLTVAEFEEWGNPANREEYEYIKGYCPYTNLTARSYPTMLVRTAFHDSQVMYWEPAKYVARLRTLKTDANPLLFKVNMAAGHGGASGRYDYLRDLAFDYAFLLTQWGLQTAPASAARPAEPAAAPAGPRRP